MLRCPLLIAIATLLLTVACQPKPTQSNTTEVAAPRDLSLSEARGGHTLRKHVGRSDADLYERLQREPNISAASTYTDRATAERVVASAIEQNRDRIERWLRSSSHPNLVLDYVADQPIGRTLRRGSSHPEPCNRAEVVLKYDAGDYYVLTSYPNC